MIWLASALAGPVLVDAPPPTCAEEAERTAGSWQDEGLPVSSDRVAVVVGVPCHDDPAIPSLAWSTRDATRVASQLDAAGYDVIRLATDVDVAELEAGLVAARETLTPDGTLVVYFSGHGVLREEQGVLRRYLVFSDTRLAEVERSGVALMDLDAWIADVPAAHRVMLQDTCFAARAEQNGKSLGLPAGVKGLSLPEGHLRLDSGDQRFYASRFFEQALESPEHGASVYTHHWLQALDGRGDLDGDGCVGSLEAHDHARRATEAERGGFQVPQHRGGAVNLPLSGSCGAATHAVIGRPAGQPDWKVSPGFGAVEPGTHRVEVAQLKRVGLGEVDRDTLARRTLSLRAGDWVDVQRMVDDAAPSTVIDAGVVAHVGAVLPTWGGAASLWSFGRDRGNGRVALGAIGEGGAGRIDAACFGSGSARARVGGLWGRTVSAGGFASAGLYGRQPHAGACSEPGLPWQLGLGAGAGARVQVQASPGFVVGVEPEIVVLPRDGAATATGAVRIGLGWALR